MKKLWLGWLACLLVTGLIGCGTVGKDFDVDHIKEIQVGKSTKSDIRNIFGDPFKTGIQNGKPLWVYEYNYYHTLGDDTSKDLVIFFDNNGIVERHQLMSSGPLN